MRELSLYLHIPFCVRKCAYCDFPSSPENEETRERYVNCLIREIRSYQGSELARRPIATIFIGGGTPSVLSTSQLVRIMDSVRDTFMIGAAGLHNRATSVDRLKGEGFDVADLHNMECGGGVEISMEVNPGSVTPEKCKELCKHIANRFSIGLQSANDEELQRIGRIHNYRQFLKTYDSFRENGCHNINVDLMSGLPGQGLEGWANSLHKVAKLSPEHISAYSLILEEGTKLFDTYARDLHRGEAEWKLPEEDEERRMYHETARVLQEYGYGRYEISNYAKEGYACRHNMVYWKRGDYLGLGLAAASCVDNVRWKNDISLHNYTESLEGSEDQVRKDLTEKGAEQTKDFGGINTIRQEAQRLTEKERIEETMFLGLRMMEGVDITQFENTFGRSVYCVYGQVIDKYTDLKLLEIRENRIRLTEPGIDVSNTVFADFLLD